jgi:hypothetical protein
MKATILYTHGITLKRRTFIKEETTFYFLFNQKGIHNYRGDHLSEAVSFLKENFRKFPQNEMLSPPISLYELKVRRDLRFALYFINFTKLKVENLL